ncbi:Mitochondrial import inner membrane translocase subunit Tim13 [Echinococcus granulosus]|uniref:Mitochondrial import inner membrane translocase subunit n=2 Tax=Echinococcus TaxID=6209 RepID=U6JG16_ECHGR|nr:Mitochondrial import inner membrane translocase subunit Tim13 [Echinococcus granulosus]EUB57521.1 Mitochondrial import inner membrane translocase subunit Tim13 [Echinococcus granulosus]KAH9277940.1 Mitochondrial import inner membrane translocase subunit Tim13 [Echinococcus granulosus]CDS20703.1 mitochondrial import inner membrane translocase [Echinococcus granulosus]CDS43624.1 mitochondrial import inner membrane translocase [Echinococcus multilocularis]
MDQEKSPLSSLTPSQRAQLVDQMKAEVAIASTRELMDQLTQKCFEKCVSRPGTSLDNSEQKCLGNCMDRYMDSVNLVSKVFANRLRQEANKLQQLS